MSFDLKKYLAEGRLFDEPGFEINVRVNFTDDEKEVFKTADEINQIWVIEHAYKRQEFV